MPKRRVSPKRRVTKARRRNPARLLLRAFAALALAALLALGVPNLVMFLQNTGDIESTDAMSRQADSFNADAIMVLGAAVRPNGSPSPLLQDRLDVAIKLYKQGVAPKIIMSGDNSDSHYNEVMNMCNYAVEQGVSKDDIFCDHAGVNTYDSMYRAKNVFGAKHLVIVTNEYHLYRSMFLCRSFGVDARGVASDQGSYTDMDYYEQREFFARVKDFYGALTNAEPSTYSEPVSLEGSGTVTQWWKKSSQS